LVFSSAAYLNDGKYNVFAVDWGKLAAVPCYAAAVHNLKPVAKCAALMLSRLRTAGLGVDRLTCVGHSLGAHLCGVMANYLPFRMHRIIGTYMCTICATSPSAFRVRKPFFGLLPLRTA